jgi:6-phosphogluconolactonase (cycloisomerase 2 family)
VGGTISGLTGEGLVLQDNGGNNLAVSAGATSFTFTQTIAGGGSFDVTVSSQPSSPTQTCIVTNGMGVAANADITSVQVTCTTNAYTIGGIITGLTGDGLVLHDNRGNFLPVAAGATSFTFTPPLQSGAEYSIGFFSQPSNPTQTCAVANGSGIVASANITSVQVTCTTNSYTIGGMISGLTGSGLLLQDNGGNNLAVAAGASSFRFAGTIASGGMYSITVSTQPSSENCSVSNGTGSVTNANVTNIQISCAADVYTIGGTISGLTGNGLVLQDNGGDNLAVAAGATTFTFNGTIAAGGSYAVTILSQAANQTCTVSNGSGIVTNANINSIQIVCIGGGPFLYVTNQGNGTNGGSLGVYSIGAAGNLTPISGPSVPTNMQPFALVADPQGQWLFVTDRSSGTIFTYQINPQTGALTASGNTSIGVSESLVIHPSGAWLYATVPDGAPGVYAFSVNRATGALTAVPGSPFTSLGSGASNIVLDPTGQFAFVSNNGSGTVAAFSINGLNGQLIPIGTIAAGTPGNAAVSGSSKSLYVMDDLAHVIRAFSIASDGSLAPLSTPVFQGVSNPQMPAISPNGQFLYVPNWSNGGTVPPNTVSVFSIDPSTSILGPIAGSPFATRFLPASVTIDSQGQFAYVADQAPNDISVFALNSSSGAMTPSSTAAAGETPTRIAIVDPTSNVPDTIIYSSMGDVCCSAFNVSGATSSQGYAEAAMLFVPTSSSQLTRIDVSLTYTGGTNSGPTLTLNSDSGGLPGAVLMSWNLTGPLLNILSNAKCCTAIESVTANSQLVLNAGSRYWLVASPGASDTWDGWVLGGITATVAVETNPGGPFSTLTDNQGGFTVYGH